MAYSKEGGPYFPQETATTADYEEALKRLDRFGELDTRQIRDMDGLAVVFDSIGGPLQTFITRNSPARPASAGEGLLPARLERMREYGGLTAQVGPTLVTITRFIGKGLDRRPVANISIPLSGTIMDAGIHFGAVQQLGINGLRSANDHTIEKNVHALRLYLSIAQTSVKMLVRERVKPTPDSALPTGEVTLVRRPSKP